MTQESTAKNGARAKILSTLAREGMLPVLEIAQLTRLTAKQVRDNAGAARANGLITNERDDETQMLAYKITPAGRRWLDDEKITSLICSCGPDPNESGNEPEPEVKESLTTHEESSAVAAPEPDWEIVDEAPIDEEILAEPIEIESEAEDFDPVADQPEIDRPIYAVTSYNGGVEVVGDDINLAIGRAISFASAGDTVARVYQLVPIGETYTTVGFRHAAA